MKNRTCEISSGEGFIPGIPLAILATGIFGLWMWGLSVSPSSRTRIKELEKRLNKIENKVLSSEPNQPTQIRQTQDPNTYDPNQEPPYRVNNIPIVKYLEKG